MLLTSPLRSGPPLRGAQTPSVPTSKYLTFRLGEELYGIDILSVQEIRSYEVPTRMAHAPEFIKGVIHLRGMIVPVVDLRLKLRCAQASYDAFTVIVVLRVGDMLLGAVVDAVADVVALPVDAIKAAPHFQGAMDTAYVRGIAQADGQMLIVVDIAALLSPAELGILQQATAATET
ncbi:chemotaxis protein CheW [Diaphorobacter aerolatus]|uniref:Chemotaxis protein CheW n=1 Tax=Diaphorobacter aerolatus TaxID=1288495 RepID=A0A7H0GLB0_9BURK|nr:chemotaxis protein CheW [Diaphorobacter aerolatus]QNP49076.1 purine-binding chemotaxis protein CheW [Diaphorobacter aerolatus]